VPIIISAALRLPCTSNSTRLSRDAALKPLAALHPARRPGRPVSPIFSGRYRTRKLFPWARSWPTGRWRWPPATNREQTSTLHEIRGLISPFRALQLSKSASSPPTQNYPASKMAVPNAVYRGKNSGTNVLHLIPDVSESFWLLIGFKEVHRSSQKPPFSAMQTPDFAGFSASGLASVSVP
jgi:hypothetical protein